MTDSVLTVTRDGDVRIVTLNRPAALNAADAQLHRRLSQIWRELEDDHEARAVILTGAGSAFSAGGEFSFMESYADPETRWRVMEEARRIIVDMLHFPLPVVCAMNGPAVGLGASLAVMCDLVLMSADAFIADPHVAVGLVAGDGGAATWPAHVSLLHAKEFLFLGDRIDAQRAVQMGLANRVVAPEKLAGEALALARRLAALPQHALRDTKRALNASVEANLSATRHYGLAAERYAMGDGDHVAFVAQQKERAEKRR